VRPPRALAALAALLATCAPPDGVPASPFEPILARLDRDGDGTVRAEEWEAVAPGGPPFAAVDADGDGALSAAEVAAFAAGQDPVAFDGPAPERTPASLGDDRPFPGTPSERALRDWERFREAEARWRDTRGNEAR